MLSSKPLFIIDVVFAEYICFGVEGGSSKSKCNSQWPCYAESAVKHKPIYDVNRFVVV